MSKIQLHMHFSHNTPPLGRRVRPSEPFLTIIPHLSHIVGSNVGGLGSMSSIKLKLLVRYHAAISGFMRDCQDQHMTRAYN